MKKMCVRFSRVPTLVGLLGLAALGLTPASLVSQDRPAGWNPDAILQDQNFVRPPEAIADAVLAPRHLNITLTDISPDRAWFLDEIGDGPVTMDRFSKDFHDLGGEFIDYQANRSRTLTIRSDAGLQLISATDGTKRTVQLPAGLRVSNAKWSPDGGQVAFYGHTPDATHIWVTGTNGQARRLIDRPILATLYTDFDWSEDGSTIATVLVPQRRAAMPAASRMPMGPQVKQTEEGENMLRVYASLMATPHDQALLEWDATGQVALIDVASRRVREIGSPTMVRDLDVSPDGEHVLVTRMTHPFSYVVPVRQFGSIQEVWDASGTVLATVTTTKLDTGIEGGPRADGPGFSGSGEAEGPRDLRWAIDSRGLIYLEQEPADDDEDDMSSMPQEDGERPRRPDRVVLLSTPFGTSNRSVLYENDRRMSSVRQGSEGNTLLITERQGQRVHEFAVFLDDGSEKHTLARYAGDDIHANPGSLVGTGGQFPGRSRFGGANGEVMVRNGHAFYQGTWYAQDPTAEGPKSFIDRVDLRTGDKERVYESENGNVFERPLAWVDLDAGTMIVSRESKTEVPQSYLRSGSGLRQLTQNVDYTPDLTNAPRREFKVTRPDGFSFNVNVTLPPNYREGTRLPAMFWFYPREYTDQEDYDEGSFTNNRNEFPNYGTRSMAYLVRLGYAVVEPDAPIVGDAGAMNNNYENDLRNNLAAVIDELDARGLIDRRRLGIGGHSYGAFSTVNAMVHTPFFKAGIAGDGNYNRTLTPLHFQSERRTLWEARDVYISMSPFLQANNLTGALLMYHGLHDQNVGTDPIHSPKLFHALNGLNKEAAMYLYPYEDHGPASEATLLDLWGRWAAWLDKHLVDDSQQAIISDQDGAGGAG